MAAMSLRLPQESGSPPRALIGSRTRTRRPRGLLGHLARSTSDNARAEGVVFAARELLRMEGLLRAFRAHLLDTPLEDRGDSYNMTLAMIELMIQREALSRSTAHPKRAVATFAGRVAQRTGGLRERAEQRRVRGAACAPRLVGRQRRGAHVWRSFAAHARHRSARADRTARIPAAPRRSARRPAAPELRFSWSRSRTQPGSR
jgi:hypothetical protein